MQLDIFLYTDHDTEQNWFCMLISFSFQLYHDWFVRVNFMACYFISLITTQCTNLLRREQSFRHEHAACFRTALVKVLMFVICTFIVSSCFAVDVMFMHLI